MPSHEPPGESPDRRAELLGGAVAGDLTASEQEELAALLRADPGAARELASLTAVAAELVAHGGVEQPPVRLADRVHRAARPTPARRVAVAAAAALVFGLGGVAGLAAAPDTAPAGAVVAAPTGPPGTLGAVEPVAVRTLRDGLTAQARVVAHTWGTETQLDVAGLPAGTSYAVVVVAADGSETGAGTFVATDGTVECVLNAAVLREDAEGVVVRGPDGQDVLTAGLPTV